METPDPKMTELRDELYQMLVDDHGFQVAERYRTAGTLNGVVYDSVEISAVPFDIPQVRADYARVDVQISVPVNARKDKFFTTVKCGGREYLSPRESIILRQRADLQAQIGLIVDLAQRGSAIIKYCGLPLHDYWGAKK